MDAYNHKANSRYARDLVRGGSSREADQKLNKQTDCASQYKHKYDVLGMSPCGVQIPARSTIYYAEIAQLVEHLPCKEGVAGSIPVLGSK